MGFLWILGHAVRQEPWPQDALSTLGSLWNCWPITTLRFLEALLFNVEFLQAVLLRYLEGLRSVWKCLGGTALNCSDVLKCHTVTPGIWSLLWSHFSIRELLDIWKGWEWETVLYLTVCSLAFLCLLTFYHSSQQNPGVTLSILPGNLFSYIIEFILYISISHFSIDISVAKLSLPSGFLLSSSFQ